jgi:hypothetical protein
MEVKPYRIESEAEADDYLKDLLAKEEYRSIHEVQIRAQKYIEDDSLRKYFVAKAEEILKS